MTRTPTSTYFEHVLFPYLIRLCTVAATALAAAAQGAPTVNLGYAQYQGAVNAANNITHFLGVRYAAAPLGDLRFRAPQPPATISSGSSPTNPLAPRQTIPQSEDCLFLNVFYPSNAAGAPLKNLPTLVWIHGGGYLAGSANGVVVVVIQYRLGVFGFLPGAAVKKSGSLNAGLLDQDFALRWVQQHITKFGGDPAKVTIWAKHLVANGGQTKPQLFRGAITSSSFLPSHCATANDALTCLRGVAATTLETANTNINSAGFFGTFVVVPRPTVSLAQRKVNGKALLAVTNAFEGTVFVDQNANTVGALYAGLGNQQFQVNAVQGECIFWRIRIPPALHGNDVAYYFPNGNAPPFNNTAFINAFAQSFTSIGNTEMLFNKTADTNEPVVHQITTAGSLLQRCRFWDSVGNLTAQ
ncbi:COesterase domain-containing protein [Favolaschia claudopus]|uniref:COesterase domain-containing protein n=1 Tax=Favolaschia claudopus TaxID=2862362 RepID=A0AAV9ZID3_9AGAR